MSELTDPLIGCLIGSYSIESFIGAGGMGRVYKARHHALDRIVALKILPEQVSNDDQYLQRFLREAKLAASLQHPNLVEVYDFGTMEHGSFIVMEYVEGSSVGKLIREVGRLQEKEILLIAKQVLNALAYAHKKGVIHRDIKPDNLLLRDDWTVKVADLGLAKAETQDVSLTMSGMTLGTPSYMSPEQILEAKKIDGRADLYSLGATLFHCATGQPPFIAPSSVMLMNKHLQDPPPTPKHFAPDLSEETSSFILRLLQKNKDYRYRDAEEAEKIVVQLLDGGSRKTQEVVFIEEPSFFEKLKDQAFPIILGLVLIGFVIAFWKWEPWMKKSSVTRNESSQETPFDQAQEQPSSSNGSIPLAGKRILNKARLPEFNPNLIYQPVHLLNPGVDDGVFAGEMGQPIEITRAEPLELTSRQRIYLRLHLSEIYQYLLEKYGQKPEIRQIDLVLVGKITTMNQKMTLELSRLNRDIRDGFAPHSKLTATRELFATNSLSQISFNVTEDIVRSIQEKTHFGWVLTTPSEGRVMINSSQHEDIKNKPSLKLHLTLHKNLLPPKKEAKSTEASLQ